MHQTIMHPSTIYQSLFELNLANMFGHKSYIWTRIKSQRKINAISVSWTIYSFLRSNTVGVLMF